MVYAPCLLKICFVPLNPAGQKFFGFSEYLAALALMILVWTTTDVRSRFRIATAPIPLHRLSFGTIAVVGGATLLTDLWRAEGWFVPRGWLFTPSTWQALLGGLFLMTFLCWGWFAYVSPPRYGPRNAHRFGSFLLSKTMEGNESDLAILAQELARSIPNLIKATPLSRPTYSTQINTKQSKIPPYNAIAHDILLLMGDPRLCRAMISSAPGTIQDFFTELKRQNKFDIPIYTFCRNVTAAAIENRNSFIYHEDDGFDTGLLGHIRPVSQAIFGSHALVHATDSLLDPDYRAVNRWSADQWDAYARVVIMTFGDYVANYRWNHSFVLSRAFDSIGRAARDIYKLNGTNDGSGWEEDSVQCLQVSVDFCEKAIKILEDVGLPETFHLRIRKDNQNFKKSIYDDLVDLMYNCIKQASRVKAPTGLCWVIQHNSVWSEFFERFDENTSVRRAILFKLRRKLYDEIKSAESFPNYVNVRILSYCLNVMGLSPPIRTHSPNSRPLHKAVLAWTIRCYAPLAERSPQVFADCLPAGLSYERAAPRLVKTYEADAFRQKPTHIYLDLNSPPTKPTKSKTIRSRKPNTSAKTLK